ncbi:hypothetical protein CYLTODRAFT_422880 [Cylindrobasidium torrendii FP15055 ss-10]|uniref:C2H2-type domain-containing protein n=1 Tax=Cylindrobasidium torrendii FP15055 ss-10 TaxID=1314674 RepID=A0A0D7B9Z3_9AGAR|nr:hypothetical protein CYLTODRAFT_422880 [Cylindrobasidium torrendii FP15055 ss-10]
MAGKAKSKNFLCDSPGCQYVGDSKGALEAHRRVHTSTHTVSCPFEGCTFTTRHKASLIGHERTHTNERPYACTYPNCTYRSRDPSTLKVHERRHTGDKPYMCTEPGCDFRDVSSSSLRAHERRHHPQKCGIRCRQCNAGFIRQSELVSHMATVHSYKSSSFDMSSTDALEPQKKSRTITRRKRGAPAGSDSMAAESQDDSDYAVRRGPARKRVRHQSSWRTPGAEGLSVASSSRGPSEPILAKSSSWPHIPETVQTDDGCDGITLRDYTISISAAAYWTLTDKRIVARTKASVLATEERDDVEKDTKTVLHNPPWDDAPVLKKDKHIESKPPVRRSARTKASLQALEESHTDANASKSSQVSSLRSASSKLSSTVFSPSESNTPARSISNHHPMSVEEGYDSPLSELDSEEEEY